MPESDLAKLHQAALQLSQQQQSPLAKTQWTSYYLLITIASLWRTLLFFCSPFPQS